MTLRTGLTHQDQEIANILRRSQKPVLLVANKLDHDKLNDILYEGYALGLGEAIGISSTNMLGLGDLLDEIVSRLPDAAEAPGNRRQGDQPGHCGLPPMWAKAA